MKKRSILILLLVGAFFLSACGSSSADATPTVDVNALYTAAAETMVAGMTQTAQAPLRLPYRLRKPLFLSIPRPPDRRRRFSLNPRRRRYFVTIIPSTPRQWMSTCRTGRKCRRGKIFSKRGESRIPAPARGVRDTNSSTRGTPTGCRDRLCHCPASLLPAKRWRFPFALRRRKPPVNMSARGKWQMPKAYRSENRYM